MFKHRTAERLPDVIFVGFPHAGSRFLRSYFDHHPDIFWQRTGRLFMQDNFESLDYRESTVSDCAEKAFIDVFELLAVGYYEYWDDTSLDTRFSVNSNLISQNIPNIDAIPQRIKKTLPDAKILMVIRNQIDWLRSNYLYQFRRMKDSKTKNFADYINTNDGKRIIHAAQFHHTIQAYYEIFDKKNVCVILLEQIRDNLEESLNRICEFMDIPYVDFPPDRQKRQKGIAPGLANIIKASEAIGLPYSFIEKITPVLSPFKNICAAIGGKDSINRNEKALLHACFSRSNYHSSELIGIDLSQYGYPT